MLMIEIEKGTQVPESVVDLFNFETVHKVYLRDITSSYRTDSFGFVFYACDCLNDRQLRWLIPLAQENPQSQFLILAQQISIHAYRLVASMGNIITLQLPLKDELLKQVVSQLMPKASSELKRFPRFITDEPVRMVVMETGLLIPSRMKNYSMSGAFIEYKGIHLRVGHNLKVNLPKQESPLAKKKLQLDGRIIWIREAHGKLASNGIGVQFAF